MVIFDLIRGYFRPSAVRKNFTVIFDQNFLSVIISDKALWDVGDILLGFKKMF